MTKTVRKAKKTSKPKKKVAAAKAHTRVEITNVVRSAPRHRSSQRSGYYALGGVALLLGVVSAVLSGMHGGDKVLTANDLIKTNQRAPAGASDGSSSRSLVLSPILKEQFEKAKALSFSERIKFWSFFIEKNVENRKDLVALTTGKTNEDIVPFIPEKFNCTTFVETVAALSRSESPAEFVDQLIAIRYQSGKVGFGSRNHFPEAQWIPNNEKENFLSDITSKVAQEGSTRSKIEKKKIDREKWLSLQVKENVVPSAVAETVQKEWKKPISAQVSYVTISDVEKILSKIPDGTILNLVHKNDSRHPVLITHQGIVIREEGQVLLRHSSRDGYIRTNVLSDYLMRLKNQRHSRTWPLIGVSLLQLHSPQMSASTSDNKRLSESM